MIGTVSSLLSYLGIPPSESALAEQLLVRANAILESWIGRKLSETSYTLEVAPAPVSTIALPVIPVKTVSLMYVLEISTSSTFLSHSDLMPTVVDPNAGLVQLQTILPGTSGYLVHVEYVAGYSSTDENYNELETAVYELAGILYRRRGALDVTASTLIERTEVAQTPFLSPFLEGVVQKYRMLGPAKGTL